MKGRASIVVIVVGLIIAVTFIIIGTFILNYNTPSDIRVQTDFKSTEFETNLALYHILDYNRTRENITAITLEGGDDVEIENDIRTNVRASMTAYSSNRPYQFRVIAPNSENSIYQSFQQEDTLETFRLNVASPKSEEVTAELLLGRD